ncbi:MAG: pyrroline-5-carboxylate reductase [Micrococcales bacterium]|nr:pyrroline-5-carboxylate reductase [Micrococcales bacterium]
MQIGFIGAGAMAGAIIKGVISAGHLTCNQLGAYDVDTAKLATLAEQTSITAYSSNQHLLEHCDVVVLAIKPHLMAEVLEQIAPTTRANHPLIISIAAGISLAKLANWLGDDQPLIRVMPNLNVQVSAGMTAIVPNQVAKPAQVTQALDLFGALGQTMLLEERLIPAFTAVAGSSPAWVFQLIDALARGGLVAGLPKQLGLQAATQAVFGSAKLLAASDLHPGQLIDQVASPGGTTVAGLTELDNRGFGAAVVAAVAATIRREGELAN